MSTEPTTDQAEDTPPAATEPPQSDVPADQTQPDPEATPAVDVDAIVLERDQLAAQVARLQVAADTGVPAALLSGNTPEELAASADALKAYADSQRRTPDFGAGVRGEHIRPTDTDPIRTALRR